MRLGVTGHQQLTNRDGWSEVERTLRRILAESTPPLLGISSLATGADQLFARLVLQLGGDLAVVLPFAGYERTFQGRDIRAKYLRLLRRASQIETLDWRGSPQECYLAAGKRVVDRSEVVVAVWDGRPAQRIGGTADVVDYARSTGRPTILVDVGAWR